MQVTTVSSVHHVELRPGDAGNNDRVIVQDLIKEIAQTPPSFGDKAFRGVRGSRFGKWFSVYLDNLCRVSSGVVVRRGPIE